MFFESEMLELRIGACFKDQNNQKPNFHRSNDTLSWSTDIVVCASCRLRVVGSVSGQGAVGYPFCA